MIDRALVFLKTRLNEYLQSRIAASSAPTAEERVVFADTDKVDPISFRVGAVTLLLVNTELERTLRAPDRYVRARADGTAMRVQPDIRLNLSVLFVVRFQRYEDGLGYLSEIIRYFQAHPVFDRGNAPELGDDIERLVIELVTMPLAQQNELWGSLRTTYQPSVLYKVGLIIYRDEDAAPVEPVRELDRSLGGMS